MGIEKDLDELFSYDTVCSIAARDAGPGALAVAFVSAVPNACQRRADRGVAPLRFGTCA